MNPTTTDLIIGFSMLVIAVFLVVAFLRYKAGASERRMQGMLERCGIDPGIIASGDKQAIIREMRRHCHKCQSEDVCERWLSGEETGANAFCPNAKTFEVLSKSS